MGRHRKEKLLSQRQNGETTPVAEVMDEASMALVAATDQSCAQAASMGKVVAAYYLGLTGGGLPPEVAGPMAEEYGSMLCSKQIFGAPTLMVEGS